MCMTGLQMVSHRLGNRGFLVGRASKNNGLMEKAGGCHNVCVSLRSNKHIECVSYLMQHFQRWFNEDFALFTYQIMVLFFFSSFLRLIRFMAIYWPKCWYDELRETTVVIHFHLVEASSVCFMYQHTQVQAYLFYFCNIKRHCAAFPSARKNGVPKWQMCKLNHYYFWKKCIYSSRVTNHS